MTNDGDSLEQLLCKAFGSAKIDDTITLQRQFAKDFSGAQHALVVIDEYQADVQSTKRCIESAASWWTAGFKVFLVICGTRPVYDVPLSNKLPYDHLRSFEVKPLEASSALLHRSFCASLGVDPELNTVNLKTLLRACGGFPASVMALRQAILHPSHQYETALNQLRANGILSISDAQRYYDDVLSEVKSRYGESRWRAVFSAQQSDRVSDNTRELLERIMFFALDETVVTTSDPVLASKPSVTYLELEASGMLALDYVGRRKERGGQATVRLPLLALAVMDDFMKVVPFGVLSSPFGSQFFDTELVGQAALAVRLKAKRLLAGARNPATMSLSDLRPGAVTQPSSAENDLVINVPEHVTWYALGSPLTKAKAEVRSGADGMGPVATVHAGTVATTALNEKGTDGVALLDGAWCKQPADIVVLSQYKSLLPTSEVLDQPMTQGELAKILQALASVLPANVKALLDAALSAPRSGGPQQPGSSAASPAAAPKQVVIVYDVLTDKELGARFKETRLELPPALGKVVGTGSARGVVVLLTHRLAISQALGSVLSLRGSLKRERDGAVDQGRKGVKQQRKP